MIPAINVRIRAITDIIKENSKIGKDSTSLTAAHFTAFFNICHFLTSLKLFSFKKFKKITKKLKDFNPGSDKSNHPPDNKVTTPPMIRNIAANQA
jgi:hypothetical protein